MKAAITLVTGILLQAVNCQAQKDPAIIDYFQKARAWEPQDFIFASYELIELCKDSVNRKKFDAAVSRAIKVIDNGSKEASKEKALLMKTIWNGVSSVVVETTQDRTSKMFLEEKLKQFNVPLEVTDELVESRFLNEDDLTFCTACSSMYLFLVYNPELYIRVRSKEADFATSQVHFPNAYILQDCNRPIELMRRIQSELLTLLKNYDDTLLKKVYFEIENCDLTNRCD